MTTPSTIKAEYLRATGVEADLQRQIDALKPPAPPAPPAPAPTPAPSGKVWTAPTTLTTAQLEAAIRDMTLDAIALPPTIQLAKGVTGDMPSVHAGVDRSARPLRIYAPAGCKMLGSPGIYYDGQFNWGGAKWISLDDVGIEASGFQLSQTGLHSIGGGDHLTIRHKISGITLSPTTDPWKTWGGYIAGSRNDHLVVDLECLGAGNLWSGVQIDSTATTQGAITIRIVGSDLALAFYENVPTEALDVTAILTNVRDVVKGSAGLSRTGASVIFHKAKGVYRVTKDAASGPIVVNTSGMVAA